MNVVNFCRPKGLSNLAWHHVQPGRTSIVAILDGRESIDGGLKCSRMAIGLFAERGESQDASLAVLDHAIGQAQDHFRHRGDVDLVLEVAYLRVQGEIADVAVCGGMGVLHIREGAVVASVVPHIFAEQLIADGQPKDTSYSHPNAFFRTRKLFRSAGHSGPFESPSQWRVERGDMIVVVDLALWRELQLFALNAAVVRPRAVPSQIAALLGGSTEGHGGYPTEGVTVVI